MEIRIDNTITLREIEELKISLNDFFNVDFYIIIEGTYCFFREEEFKK